LKRREVLKNTVLASAGLGVIGVTSESCSPKAAPVAMVKDDKPALKGKVNHSACRWCYQSIPLEELLDKAKDIGLKSIELLSVNEWDAAIKRGMTCAISKGSSLGITRGFNDVQYHDQLKKDYFDLIPKAADKGISQIICFSGNRGSITDAIGIEHCAKGLDHIMKLAEKHNVKIVMELLNSKVDHGGYMCDKTPWGAALAEKLGSPNFKLLYDIYHMQIMEGDVIATIRKYNKYISHYHTGGVPGRNEIDQTQELNYKAIIEAIMATGFTGFIAQEFIPKNPNALESLKQGVLICDV
jgi:hydroxypyruvate isomerase